MRICLTFLLIIFCQAINGQVNLNQGLKAYYPFSGNANDASGSGLHGVMQGQPTLTTDRFGNPNSAYQFNGVNEAIIITDKGKLSTPAFTVAYYFTTESTDLQVCIGKINYEDGHAATFNSGVNISPASTFFGTMGSIGNCEARVTTTYVHTIHSGTEVKLNQWHCVVNTFENGLEKLYLDGILVQQKVLPFNNATYCENTNLNIGTWWKDDQRRFKGKIDEVRYYDRAINADEIKALCLAENLQPPQIINDYTPVTALDRCENNVTVEVSEAFNPGDTVLLIQMKGGLSDSSNTNNFGTITDYKNAGKYEFNIIKKKNGKLITLLNTVERQYDIPDGKVQLIRVPFYKSADIKATLTCLPWDGAKGGVLAINVEGNLNMQANIDVSGKGFRHGLPLNSSLETLNEQDYFYDAFTNKGAQKGEGIYTISLGKNYGRGASANGGGGGNAHNSGGGGGGNGGKGGQGGDQWETRKTLTENVGGEGGELLLINPSLNRLFLGGSGGMGQANNLREYPSGNGGGIAIISAGSINTNGFKIMANGDDAAEAPNSDECKDGMAGGGAGGSILLHINNPTSAVTAEANGGKGADHIAKNELHGPGGGGGGGVIAISQFSTPVQFNFSVSGGMNGVNVYHANNPWGAAAGEKGRIMNNYIIYTDQIKFIKNIDSVGLKENITNCKTVDFSGTAHTQYSPIASWLWNFGDGNTSTSQNPKHTYTNPGNYEVKLVATDEKGCRDGVLRFLTITDLNITKSRDTALCENSTMNLFAGGGNAYSWSPATGLDNPNIANPMATPLVSTKYHVKVSDASGCTKEDSVNIMVNSLPEINKSKDTTICSKTPAPLMATGGVTYTWSPAASLNNPHISNPVASPASSTTYSVKVTNAAGCSKEDTISVEVNPVPDITRSKDTLVCRNSSVKLFVSGGTSWSWTPLSGVDNSTSATPIVSPANTTTYFVDIADAFSCTYKDSVKVAVREPALFSVSPNSSVCVNSTYELTASGGTSYTWQPATDLNDPNISNPVATTNTTKTYSVTIIENICNESAILSTTLTALPLPDIKTTKSNDVNCSFPHSNLAASGAQSYSWTPATGLSNDAIQNPVATPAVTTTYTVTGKDTNGCENTNNVTVKVLANSNTVYELPNSFTPNGDGLNDCFGIGYWGVVQELDFSIYNRYGQRVFYTNDVSRCWDGKFKGQVQVAGAFVYVVRAKTACGDINRKGTVTLLK